MFPMQEKPDSFMLKDTGICRENLNYPAKMCLILTCSCIQLCFLDSGSTFLQMGLVVPSSCT